MQLSKLRKYIQLTSSKHTEAELAMYVHTCTIRTTALNRCYVCRSIVTMRYTRAYVRGRALLYNPNSKACAHMIMFTIAKIVCAFTYDEPQMLHH